MTFYDALCTTALLPTIHNVFSVPTSFNLIRFKVTTKLTLATITLVRTAGLVVGQIEG